MIKAKKSLGQNFLIDQNIIDKIVNIIDLSNKDILEVGPGTTSRISLLEISIIITIFLITS